MKLKQVKVSDVIKENKAAKQIYLGGNLVTEKELAELREEANYITRTKLWSIMTNTLADVARTKMFEEAENFDDMMWGKAILYAVDIQEKILKLLKKTHP